MRVLVTGGSGFIGSHVVDKLRDHGHKVRVFDMLPYVYRDDVEWYKGSLLNYDELRMAVNAIDVVYHLAAVADVNDVYNDPLYAENINVRGTIHVLEAARRSGRVQRVILGSTVWAYSESKTDRVDEMSPLSPPSHLYTATKIASEYYCHSYTELYKLPTTVLRYGIPYGPRAREAAVIPTFVKKALNGEPITVAGDGLQYRKFVYVEDLAEGNALAMADIAAGKLYNLEGQTRVSIREVAEAVQRIVGNATIQFTESRPGDFSGKEIASDLARTELGWTPRVGIEEGIRRYVDWYKRTLTEA
ncbi:MAG TPA: NAD-dependent epimerase/dehydratase family protein [Chloroflexota bacterium]|nr:NAD-dependent epimerase/dehydratase family protein [Chloroflexota bacterium]